MCFCRKETIPANHPWLVPHSCGENCGKPLKSACSHRCMLLCHPGPCPPCSQMITTTCECKKSVNPQTIRCSQNSWKCGAKVRFFLISVHESLMNKSNIFQCLKKLSCGIHTCNQTCHKECPPCTKKSQQACACGNKVQERDCNSLEWSCEKTCNKLFDCGIHRCKVKCHKPPCVSECPGLLKSCPCGKTEVKYMRLK